MNAQQFDKAGDLLRHIAEGIAGAKRPAYTHDDVDVLRNFKEGALVCATSPLQYATGHVHKHLSTIVSYGKNPATHQAEPIETRFGDLLNYIFLMWGLYIDGLSAEEKQSLITKYGRTSE